jgi:plasmid stabilization system protein ParE
MKYRIELAATAKADIRGQAQWQRENVSPAAATKWLDGLYKAIDTLQTRPLRCPVAAEGDKFPEEIHELNYGKRGERKHKHRIIFIVREDTVYVLYVRHAATNWSRNYEPTIGCNRNSISLTSRVVRFHASTLQSKAVADRPLLPGMGRCDDAHPQVRWARTVREGPDEPAERPQVSFREDRGNIAVVDACATFARWCRELRSSAHGAATRKESPRRSLQRSEARPDYRGSSVGVVAAGIGALT